MEAGSLYSLGGASTAFRMTGPAGRLRSVSRLTVLISDCLFLPCHFDRSKVKWRNITALCCVVPLQQEISRLRVSIELNAFVSMPTCSSARNDSYGEPLPCHFDRSEAKWRNLPPEVRVPLGREISRLRVSIEYIYF